MPDAWKDLPEEAHEALVRVAQVYLLRRSQALAPGPLVTLYWQDFYRLYAPVVRSALRPYVAQPADSDDVSQEIWLTIARKLPDVQWLGNPSRFRAWVGRVVQHKAVDMIRRQRCRPGRVLSALDTANQGVLAGRAEEVQPAERHWRRELVQVVLAKLRPKVSETNFHILRLHYWEGLTVPEIAGRVRLGPGQVWCRLHRLLGKLRRAFAPYLDEDF
jgi:RNA polymerase sigma factor (sigma-70 family)